MRGRRASYEKSSEQCHKEKEKRHVAFSKRVETSKPEKGCQTQDIVRLYKQYDRGSTLYTGRVIQAADRCRINRMIEVQQQIVEILALVISLRRDAASRDCELSSPEGIFLRVVPRSVNVVRLGRVVELPRSVVGRIVQQRFDIVGREGGRIIPDPRALILELGDPARWCLTGTRSCRS